LDQFICRPEALQKTSRMFLISRHSCIESLVIIKTSSMKRRWRIFINLETFTCFRFPWDWPSFRRMVTPSMTKINSRGESGKPCRKPLPLWKKWEASPLTRTEKVALETHPMIQFMEVGLKPNCTRIKRRKSQSMQSKAFFRSNLRISAFDFFALILWRHSWAMPIASMIYLHLRKPNCSLDRYREMTGFRRLAMIFVISL